MKRLAVAATGIALLCCGPAAGAAGAKAPPHGFYGIVPNTELVPSDYARMGAAKVGTLRTSVLWSSMQAVPNGSISFSGTDATVMLAAEHGITVLPVVAGTPSFAANGCSSVVCQRRVPLTTSGRNDWKQFLAAVVARYGNNGTFWSENPGVPYHPITQWQIYNEENNPNIKMTAKVYAKFVKLTDGAIKSADKKGQLMLGGMFGMPPKGGKTLAWNYLTDMYKSGAGGHFDGVAVHPYAPKLSGISSQILHIRKVLKKHHDASVPTYVTEIGWGSSKKRHGGTGGRGAAFNVGVKKQKANLKASFQLLTNNRSNWKIGGVDWFTWKDPLNPPDGLCAFCYSSGLYEANGTTAKPALGAFKAFARKAR